MTSIDNTTFGGSLRFFATSVITPHFDVCNHLFDNNILDKSETTKDAETHIGATLYF